MGKAVEIASFKLAAGYSAEDFVRANADVDPWLQRQPGFVCRWMSLGDDGTLTDVVVWESASQGEASAARLMIELADSPVHAAIDPRTVTWSVTPIIHKVGRASGDRS
jgi:hypothetical protein